MKNDLPFELLQKVADKLTVVQQPIGPPAKKPTTGDDVTRNLIGLPSETPDEVAKLLSALKFLTPDAGRGNGRFFDGSGDPLEDYWQGGVWAIRGLNWSSGEDIARNWSQGITRKPYDEDGFRQAWDSYDPQRPNPVSIRSLYKRARLLGWVWNEPKIASTETTPAEADDRSRYVLLGPHEIAKLTPVAWRLKGIFPQTGLGAIFGPSASGKSFLAFDLAASIADGEDWFFTKTSACDVTYIQLEGEAGLKNRVSAWEAARRRPFSARLRFIIQPVHLMSAEDLSDLLRVLPRNGVIFIDTLNRAAPTADENSSKDMGAILEAAKLLSRETDSLVIVVHHTGKDLTRGMRGHSSLFAALDGAIEVTRDAAGNRSWAVAKTKDGEDSKNVRFKLAVHNLGQDADGDDITSCTVEPDGSSIFTPKLPSGKVQQAALAILKGELQNSQIKGKLLSGASTPCLRVDDAITAVANSLTTEISSKRRSRAKALVTGLIVGGFLRSALDQDEGWLWLV